MTWIKEWKCPLSQIRADLVWALEGPPPLVPEQLSFWQRCARQLGWSRPPASPADPWQGRYTNGAKLAALRQLLSYLEVDLVADSQLKIRLDCSPVLGRTHQISEEGEMRLHRQLWLDLEFQLAQFGQVRLQLERQAKYRVRPKKYKARFRDRIRLVLPRPLGDPPGSCPDGLTLRRWEEQQVVWAGPSGGYLHKRRYTIRDDEDKLAQAKLWWAALRTAVWRARAFSSSCPRPGVGEGPAPGTS